MAAEHTHHCPDCDKDWLCTEAQPYWEQEDTDCRWYTVLRCLDCQKKTDLHPSCGADHPQGPGHVEPPFDVHSTAAKHLFGLEGEPTREQRNAGKNALYMTMYSPFAYRTSGPPNYDYEQAETRVMASIGIKGKGIYGKRKWYHANWILQVWDFFGGPRLLRLFRPKVEIKPIPETFQDLDFVTFMNSCRDQIAKSTGVRPEHISPTGRNVSTAQNLLDEKQR